MDLIMSRTIKGKKRQQLFIITQGDTRQEVTGSDPLVVWSPAIYTSSPRNPAAPCEGPGNNLNIFIPHCCSRPFLATLKVSRTFCRKGLIPSAPNLGSQQTSESQQQVLESVQYCGRQKRVAEHLAKRKCIFLHLCVTKKNIIQQLFIRYSKKYSFAQIKAATCLNHVGVAAVS